MVKNDDKTEEPLKTYKKCSKNVCVYYLLLDRHIERGDTIVALSGGSEYVAKVHDKVDYTFYDGLDVNMGWSAPSESNYIMRFVDGCVKNRCVLIETNTNVLWRWSWSRKKIRIPTGWYIAAAYLKTKNNIASHIPINEEGRPQRSQINVYGHPSYKDVDWMFRASSFYHKEDLNLILYLNAGVSADGNLSQAWFDELAITPMFKRERVRTLFFDANDTTPLKCWDINIDWEWVNPHTCAPDDNVSLSMSEGWIEINNWGSRGYVVGIELNGSLFSEPGYYEFSAEYNSLSYYPNITVAVLNSSFSQIGRIITNCTHNPAILELNCVALVNRPLLASDRVVLFISANPAPYYIKVRNIGVYEVRPR